MVKPGHAKIFFIHLNVPESWQFLIKCQNPPIVANYGQSMYEPLSSGHRGKRKEYFVHNWVKHCQRLTFNVTMDYLNKTRLVQSQCRTLRFKQIKHDAPCYA